MNNQDFIRAILELEEQANDILDVKGAEYTLGKGEEDRHTNFKEVANLLGLEPKQVWAIYWLKHVFSILSWVKGSTFGSEPAVNRFSDERNYCYLGYGLYLEEQEKIFKAEQAKLYPLDHIFGNERQPQEVIIAPSSIAEQPKKVKLLNPIPLPASITGNQKIPTKRPYYSPRVDVEDSFSDPKLRKT